MLNNCAIYVNELFPFDVNFQKVNDKFHIIITYINFIIEIDMEYIYNALGNKIRVPYKLNGSDGIGDLEITEIGITGICFFTDYKSFISFLGVN